MARCISLPVSALAKPKELAARRMSNGKVLMLDVGAISVRSALVTLLERLML